MQHLTVRKAAREDIGDILRVTQAAFEQYRLSLDLPQPPAALTETEADVARDFEGKELYIGLVNNMLAIGSIRCEILEGGVAYVSRFAVSPNWQSSGMGRALLEAVERDCVARGVKAITLHTATRMFNLARFYYGQGFFVHSTTQDRGYIRGLFVKELDYEGGYCLDEVLKK